MLALRFRVKVQPDRIDEAIEVFSAVVEPSRRMEGVVSFDIGRDLLDPTVLIATEVFEDAAARERQEAQAEVARVMELLPEIVAEPPQATQFEVASTSDPLAAG